MPRIVLAGGGVYESMAAQRPSPSTSPCGGRPPRLASAAREHQHRGEAVKMRWTMSRRRRWWLAAATVPSPQQYRQPPLCRRSTRPTGRPPRLASAAREHRHRGEAVRMRWTIPRRRRLYGSPRFCISRRWPFPRN